MAFKKDASVGMKTDDSIPQNPPVPGLEGLERLVVPSDRKIKSFIPFGIDGVLVVISPYGDVLRMTKYIPGHNPRVICLGAPGKNHFRHGVYGLGVKMERQVQWRIRGLGIHLKGFPEIEDPILEWINGRWPCIRYGVDGILVSILFTVNAGVLSQEFTIENPSSEDKVVHFEFETGSAVLTTLRAEHGRWISSGGLDVIKPSSARGCYRIAEDPDETSQQGRHPVTDAVKGEACIAIFHNGQLLKLDDHASVPIRENDKRDSDLQSKSDHTVPSAPSGTIQVTPKGTQKFMLQCELQSHCREDSWSPRCLDVETFLKSEIFKSWSFREHHELNPVFRRYLEHILCLCLVNIPPDLGEEHRVPFMHDVTLESASTPSSDFYIFRYLLFMHQLVKKDEYVSPFVKSQTPADEALVFNELQTQIKEACAGHLRWCFDKNVLLACQSWPASSMIGSNTSESDHKPSAKFFVGTLQMLKLFEFSRVFTEETKLVKECLQMGTTLWLEALDTERDEKSRLWFKDTRKTYITWGGRREQGSEWINLPEYRLGDLVYTWKSLKSLEAMSRQFRDEEDNSQDTVEKLKESKLRARDVRETILQRFVYQPQDALLNERSVANTDNQRDTGQDMAKTEPAAVSFAIAVRRSRDRDRGLFYAKDAMLYEGIEWNFFKNDISIEAYSAMNEPKKVDVQLSWQNTMDAQGIDHETIWRKPLRYALAIIMANHDISLDNSKSPAELAKLSWEKLPKCVMDYGLFADKLDWDTKLPRPFEYRSYHNLRQTWEVATLMLGQRFRDIEFGVLRLQDDSVLENSGEDSQPPDISEEMRSSQMKKVVLEKRRTSSYKQVDLEQHALNLAAYFETSDLERKAKEWMYSYPDFITKRPPYDHIETEYHKTNESLERDLQDDLDSNPQNKLKNILTRGYENWSKGTDIGTMNFSRFNWSAVVVDVGQHRQGHPEIDDYDAEDFDIHLREARSIQDAKKRFHFHAPLEVEHALILYLATPSTEKHHMARFFSRHTSYSNSLHEDIHPLVNVWTTELHVSFFQLVEMEKRSNAYLRNGSGNEEAVGEEVKSDDVCVKYQRTFPQILKGSKRALENSSLSYRIAGDMDDKYWTGYLFTHLRADESGSRETDIFGCEDVKEWFDKGRRIDQRKILEPFLVEKMVAELLQSNDEILRAIDDWLDPEEIDAPKDGNPPFQPKVSKADDRYVDMQYNRSAICVDLDATLRVLRRLSEANVDTLGQWAKREQTRNFKPRWSEKDEFKFRELIDFQKRRVELQIARVNDQHRRIQDSIEQVRVHRQELINNINLAESRITAHESENIRIFTYATVIFYPLSFVASLFSMQGPPNHTTTSLFLQATTIALVTTLLIVFNAESLAWPIRSLRYIISDSARKRMERTPNEFPVPWKNTLDHIKDAEEHNILHDHEMPKWPRNKLLYPLFLVVYFFLDFPASRVMLAYESMKSVMSDKAKFPDHATLIVVRIFIALILLPVFAISWMNLVIWSMCSAILTGVWKLSLEKWKDIQKQHIKEHESRLENEYKADDAKAKEKEKEQEKEKEKEEEKAEAKGEAELKETDRKKNKKEEKQKTIKERIEETRREEHKAREDRIQEGVKLLINSSELNALRLRRKKKKQGDEESQRGK